MKHNQWDLRIFEGEKNLTLRDVRNLMHADYPYIKPEVNLETIKELIEDDLKLINKLLKITEEE